MGSALRQPYDTKALALEVNPEIGITEAGRTIEAMRVLLAE
ncbi:hypothetical protein QNH14_10525 [Apirhabdus apintestini]|nr:hypothetical protein QNH14_10525 [Enterobacteriaceae bacterium CA-0114]